MANKTTFETINIDDFIHDPINQEKVQSYPPELVGRFNSFIVTAFDDSMTVEMQLRTLIKWIKENIDVTTNALDNMEAFKQDSMAFQNHVKDTLVNLINNFTDAFDDNLEVELIEVLTQWDEDGYLQSLINEYTNERVDTLFTDKIDKGQVTMADLTQEVKEVLNGDRPLPIVGTESVGNTNIINNNVLSHHIKRMEIKPIHTSFIKTGNNLANFIYKDKIIGGSANASTDYRIDYAGGYVSDKIPVLEGETYTLKGIDKYLMLSKTNGIYNNIKISGVETVITIPSGVTHLYVDTYGAFTPFAMINKGGVALPYEPYGLSIPDLKGESLPKESITNLNIVNNNVLSHHIKKEEIKPIHTSFIKTGNNLADFIHKDKVIGGSNNADTDYRVDYAGGYVSDKIPVLEGETYTLKGIDKYLMLTKTNGVYNNVKIAGVETVITIPAGVTHIHVDTYGAFTPFAMINKGSEALPYEPYRLKFKDGIETNPYNNKIWVAVGDSLTEKNIRSSKLYHEYVSDDLGIKVVNMGKSGTGYVNGLSTGTSITDRVKDVPSNANVVTIFGSFNDISTGVPLGTSSDAGTDTIGGAINTAIDNLYSVLPTIPLGIISPTPWQSANLADENNALTKYARLLKEIANKRGILFLDLYFSSGLRPWEETYRTLMYSKDDGNGTHPDENGHKLFYPQVREFLKKLI